MLLPLVLGCRHHIVENSTIAIDEAESRVEVGELSPVGRLWLLIGLLGSISLSVWCMAMVCLFVASIIEELWSAIL